MIEKVRQGLREDKKFNIALLWAATWFIGVWTPMFLLIPYRKEATIPAEVLPIIAVVAMIPAVILMVIGTLRMVWQDWKRSKTKKQKIFWGVRVFVVTALAVTIVLLQEIYG